MVLGGLVAREIQEGLAEPLARRTLQRRLKRLVEEGRIRAEGKGKGTRLFPIVEAVACLREDERPAYGKEPMTLSEESLAIRERVTAPLMARTPMGYDSDFLNRYVPNKTACLSADPFPVRHRARIGELVREVVTGGMGRSEAVRWIKEKEEEFIEPEERGRFLEVVETELMSLHEGNIARFRLRLGEFAAWQKDW